MKTLLTIAAIVALCAASPAAAKFSANRASLNAMGYNGVYLDRIANNAMSLNGRYLNRYGESKGFRIVIAAGEPVGPAVDKAGNPVQAPIAETLRETGRVQLYINFATDQDKPLPSSEPVLQELLATIEGDNALRLELIGHTDSQGSAPYNLDLSQRRAAAVYLWLVQHGVTLNACVQMALV